jgi:TrmH family RNA methyltransferase
MRLDELLSVSREIVAFDPDGEPAGHLRLGAGAILAFGSERGGLSPELLRRARHRVAIPMRPGVSSLNLATAVAVVLYGLAGGPLSEHRRPSPLP